MFPWKVYLSSCCHFFMNCMQMIMIIMIIINQELVGYDVYEQGFCFWFLYLKTCKIPFNYNLKKDKTSKSLMMLCCCFGLVWNCPTLSPVLMQCQYVVLISWHLFSSCYLTSSVMYTYHHFSTVIIFCRKFAAPVICNCCLSL